jgi:hypothetical protein
MDWTAVLPAEAENRRARLAAEILASRSYQSTSEQVRAFVRQGGGCRASFFNYRQRLGHPGVESAPRGESRDRSAGGT